MLTTRTVSSDAVIVGGGHNGLAAAAYLARAGRSCLLLERRTDVGGAAVSERVFPDFDARLSRYAYLVSLLPRQIVDELGLRVRLVRRSVASYTPDPRAGAQHGLLLGGDELTRAPFRGVAGGDDASAAWRRFHDALGGFARRVFPTLTEPLRSRAELRRIASDDALWETIVEQPLGTGLERAFADDLVRGAVLTDGLIGTFAAVDDADLRQNRCFLLHVLGGGHWNVPVGGMGAVADALRDAALAAGAQLCTGAEVTAIGAGEVRFQTDDGDEHAVGARHILANVAPAELDRLRGRIPAGRPPEGAQLKVNLLLARLPRVRDASVTPEQAFSGTMHVNETALQLQRAYDEAAAGDIPGLPPCDVHCHTLSDRSILGPDLRAAGAHALTLFALHMPARLFAADNEHSRGEALAATLRSLNSVLAEPVEDCLLRTPCGAPCIEARTPLDLERELRMPGGNIFHRDLQWPFAEMPDDVGRWGVETDDPSILLCGAGARRGGGVSAIAGRNAAMAALGA